MRGLDRRRDAPDWPDADAARFLTAGGVDWRVVRRGPAGAPTLLLLHGTGGSAHSFRDMADLLADRFDLVIPDLPGHGFSGRGPGGRQSLPAMAGAVAALLEAMEARPVVIAGHSAGAAVALRLTLDGGARPATIWALNGALAPFRGLAGALFPPMARALAMNPFAPRLAAGAAALDRQATRRTLTKTGSTLTEAGVELYRRLFTTPAHVDGALRMMAEWDLEPLIADLPRLQARLVLAVGGRDRAVPPREAERLARNLPMAEIERWPDLGHLMHEEAPERFADRLAELADEAVAAEG